MPSYDGWRFSPPAPIGHAELRNPQTGKTKSEISMLLDSGADVTLLPRSAVESVGLERSDAKYELIAFDGAKSVAEAVHAELVFLSRTFRGQFLLIDQEVGILGRDILNHVSVLLDGPTFQWDESTSR